MTYKQHSHRRSFEIPFIVKKYCLNKEHYQKGRCKECDKKQCRIPKKMLDSSVIICAILQEKTGAEESKALIDRADKEFQGCVTKEIIGETVHKVWKEMCYDGTNEAEILRILEQFNYIIKRCRQFKVIDEQTQENEALSKSIQEQECRSQEDIRHISAAILENIDFITLESGIKKDEKSIIRGSEAYKKGLGKNVKVKLLKSRR